MAEVERPAPCFAESYQLIFPSTVLRPDTQAVKDGIIFIDPVISVNITETKVLKAVTRCGAEQFTAVVDRPVSVLVKGKKTLPGATREI